MIQRVSAPRVHGHIVRLYLITGDEKGQEIVNGIWDEWLSRKKESKKHDRHLSCAYGIQKNQGGEVPWGLTTKRSARNSTFPPRNRDRHGAGYEFSGSAGKWRPQ